MSKMRKGAGGLALPEVVRVLLNEGFLLWDPKDTSYIVVDGDQFELRYVPNSILWRSRGSGDILDLIAARETNRQRVMFFNIRQV